jgi:carboxymethylenebutenolidase
VPVPRCGCLRRGRLLNRPLEAARIAHSSEIYPGTVHGFTMADTDAFDPAGLKRHWERLLPLLRGAPAEG